MPGVPSLIRREGDSEQREYAKYEAACLDVDARLDEALRETFPASDPIAVTPER
jgi:hypothetical protein